MRCLRSKTAPKSRLDKLSCGELPPALNCLFNKETDHRLWATQVVGGDSSLILFCWRCGYYAQSCPKLLAAPCCQAPKSKGAIQRRKRFLQCRHPRLANVRLMVPWRFSPGSNEDTRLPLPPAASVGRLAAPASPSGLPVEEEDSGAVGGADTLGGDDNLSEGEDEDIFGFGFDLEHE